MKVPPSGAEEEAPAFRYARALAYCRRAERRMKNARAARVRRFLLICCALLLPVFPAAVLPAGAALLAAEAVRRGD